MRKVKCNGKVMEVKYKETESRDKYIYVTLFIVQYKTIRTKNNCGKLKTIFSKYTRTYSINPSACLQYMFNTGFCQLSMFMINKGEVVF